MYIERLRNDRKKERWSVVQRLYIGLSNKSALHYYYYIVNDRHSSYATCYMYKHFYLVKQLMFLSCASQQSVLDSELFISIWHLYSYGNNCLCKNMRSFSLPNDGRIRETDSQIGITIIIMYSNETNSACSASCGLL